MVRRLPTGLVMPGSRELTVSLSRGTLASGAATTGGEVLKVEVLVCPSGALACLVEGVNAMKDLYRKLQISMLWIFLAVGTPTGLALIIIEPGVLDEFLRTGTYEGSEITTAMTVQLAVFVIVPLVMAFLTLTLPYAANRLSNVIVGLVVAIFDGLDMVTHLADGEFGGEVLMITTMTMVALLIPWLAWHLPAPEKSIVEYERERMHT